MPHVVMPGFNRASPFLESFFFYICDYENLPIRYDSP